LNLNVIIKLHTKEHHIKWKVLINIY
jgi:hypothetical protein